MQDSISSIHSRHLSQSDSQMLKVSLTGLEAACFLSISPRTLEQWRRKGQGPAFVKVGKKAVRYLLPDLQAFQAQNRIEPENKGE